MAISEEDKAELRALMKEVIAAAFSFHPLTPPMASGVYYLLVGDRVKIGRSDCIAGRIDQLATATPSPPMLVAFDLGDPTRLEDVAHNRWADYRRHREWFSCDGRFSDWLRVRNFEMREQYGRPLL